MAGHPTIGSAFALAHEGRLAAGQRETVVGLGVGPTRLELEWRPAPPRPGADAGDGPREELAFAWMTQGLPQFGSTVVAPDVAARALGLAADEVARTGLPVQSVSCGLPFLFVPVATREAVDRAWLERQGLSELTRAAGIAEQGVFIFSLERAGDDATAYSRMFAPSLGVSEDPATGSASGPLGCYLVRHRAVDAAAQSRMVSLQGVKMRRPSRIVISIAGSPDRITSVRIGGTSVLTAEGTLYLGAEG
jgi:trans-2,3-dihydro-3-hydroxyanthranilate isomerase